MASLLLLCACALLVAEGHRAEEMGAGQGLTRRGQAAMGARRGLAHAEGEVPLALKSERPPSGRAAEEGPGAGFGPMPARRRLAARLGGPKGSSPVKGGAVKGAVHPKDAAILLKVLARWKHGGKVDSHNLLGTWSARRPCATWFGVTCDSATHRVTAIKLPGLAFPGRKLIFRLVGPFPAELGSLPELRSLILARNSLRGVPEAWARLRKLSHLDLSGNRLGGSMPLALWSLTRLVYLNLANSGLTDLPKQAKGLSRLSWPLLERLELSNNHIRGSIPGWLGTLTSLTDLSLAHNQLTGSIPSALGSIDGLVTLNLASNKLTGSIPASVFQPIRDVNVANNQLSGNLPASAFSILADTVGQITAATRTGVLGEDMEWPPSLDVSGNYLSGPCYSSSFSSPDLTCMVEASSPEYMTYAARKEVLCEGYVDQVMSGLSSNCLQACDKFPVSTSYPNQRSGAQCAHFCGANKRTGPCSGRGSCSLKGPKNNPTCTCSKGFIASKPGTCAPKPK